MGAVGLTLPWEHRIPPVVREGESRVAFSELEAGSERSGGKPEDAAIAAACQAGDLRGYDALYRMHGAKMRNMARNILGSASDAEDRKHF